MRKAIVIYVTEITKKVNKNQQCPVGKMQLGLALRYMAAEAPPVGRASLEHPESLTFRLARF